MSELAVNKFISLIKFYNQLMSVSSAICVKKHGIPMENYIGRFFIADTLEFITEFGKKLDDDKLLDNSLKEALENLIIQFESAKDLVTPTQKPVYEMTLEEFEKVMNI